MPSKLEKFEELKTFPNCFVFDFRDIPQGFPLKGKWRKEVFANSHPVVVELGCGKGEYTIGLGKAHQENNYIGVDIKGNRIWTGAKEALDGKLSNIAFLRTRIDFIDHCFEKDEIDELWITFPDPQPQSTRKRKRLTHPLFLARYARFLKAGGLLHLKTDSTSLYDYTLEVIQEEGHALHWHTNDLYKNCPAGREELVSIRTYYETLFTSKGEDIKYIQFSLRQ